MPPMNLDAFNYFLPKGKIAQKPAKVRSNSKLLVLDKSSSLMKDDRFFNLCEYLTSKDLLIFNDTKVIPARLFGSKETGGKVEIFFERMISDYNFLGLIKNYSNAKNSDEIIINEDVSLSIIHKEKDLYLLNSKNITVNTLLNKYGNIPLPPYISRNPTQSDEDRYQTIFSNHEGSSAAPTAGLHFDDIVFSNMSKKQIDHCFCTLHIGLGTFSPIRTQKLDNHVLHQEYYSIPLETINKIKKCKERNGRVIAVGTTVVRALESFYLQKKKVPNIFYDTNIFIKPGFDFKVIDGLITNFHLPKSSLLVLISAFYGLEKTLKAYEHAVKNDYMFFSYGDASLIL